MASSLIGGRSKDRVTDKGHGTDALGPSDSSDSASDMVGGAGADIGDVDLDSDSDSVGTGEHMTAGRDPQTRADNDIRPDHIESISEIAAEAESDADDTAR